MRFKEAKRAMEVAEMELVVAVRVWAELRNKLPAPHVETLLDEVAMKLAERDIAVSAFINSDTAK